MPETWLHNCIVQRGPTGKSGYPGIPNRPLSQINGMCAHSMEGDLNSALGRMATPLTDDPYTQASWTFSNPKVGLMLQHYPLEAVTWTSGGPVPNVRFVGIEHEGVAGDQLTGSQVMNDVNLLIALQRLVNVQTWARGQTLWEHREMVQFGSAPTACPSGRIPWPTITMQLGDDMFDTTDRDLMLKTKTELDEVKAVLVDVQSHLKTRVEADVAAIKIAVSSVAPGVDSMRIADAVIQALKTQWAK